MFSKVSQNSLHEPTPISSFDRALVVSPNQILSSPLTTEFIQTFVHHQVAQYELHIGARFVEWNALNKLVCGYPGPLLAPA